MDHAYLISFGCKVNRYEIESIKEILSQMDIGIVDTPAKADLLIFNTCAVTQKSEQRARQYIRRFINQNPKAFIVVTGCMAQLHAQELATIDGIDLILGNLEKEDIQLFLKRFYKSGQKTGFPFIFVHRHLAEYQFHANEQLLHHFTERTRAFLKIQDGCEAFCSYCIIPYLRGKYRSRSLDRVIEQIAIFQEQNFKEIVLTGIHIGKYGLEQDDYLLLPLLKRIIKETSIARIRLTSIEPNEFSEELIDFIGYTPRICRHLHIPLQSGSNRILKVMNRHYTTSDYNRLINMITNKIPEIGIGLDLIIGHPGEQESDFQDTYQFTKDLPPCYIHVFSYSDRPGTKSSLMQPKLSKETIQERTNQIIALGRYKRREFYNQFIDKKMEILVESQLIDGQWWNGLTSNYIRVHFRTSRPDVNQFVQTQLEYVDPQERVIGTLVP